MKMKSMLYFFSFFLVVPENLNEQSRRNTPSVPNCRLFWLF
uniref:Uncharacterized protein n=1 Tax=Setaria viridis TaxID=4556 RepID=A0A4U6VM21_SETVI|nr:hypothetical protein SEVIR_3G413350v2 [Setaria viridis]